MKTAMSPASRRRRENYKWTPEEKRLLIECGALRIDPKLDEEISRNPRRTLRRGSPSVGRQLTDEQRQQLSTQVRRLNQLQLDASSLACAIWEIAQQVAPWNDGLQSTVAAAQFLRISLRSDARLTAESDQEETDQLEHQSGENQFRPSLQRRCVQEWTGMHDEIWSNPFWRESLWMRYGNDDAPAVDCLSDQVKTALNGEVTRLQRKGADQHGLGDSIHEIATRIGSRYGFFFVGKVICAEYLRARVRRCWNRNHHLHRPISQSGVFQRVAALAAEATGVPQIRAKYIEGFLKYLIPRDAHSELVGRLLSDVTRLEFDYKGFYGGDKRPPGEKTPMPDNLQTWHLFPGRDYRSLADRISPALGIDRENLDQIQRVASALKLADFWERRAAAYHTVFWVAQILKQRHLSVYKAYCVMLESLHVKVLRPLTSVAAKKNATQQSRTLLPFLSALTTDPLLSCVLHYVVLNGEDYVLPSQWSKKLPDTHRNILLTLYAVRCLQDRSKSAKIPDVKEVLAGMEFHSDCVRRSLITKVRETKVSGVGEYAYAAPLITALIDDGSTVVDRYQVRDIFIHHKSEPRYTAVVNELEKDLDRFLMRPRGSKIIG